MHVGKTHIPEVCPDLAIDGWKIKETNEVETNVFDVEDELDGAYDMESVDSEKYLGDIISNDGKTSKNISARKNRGTGVVNQIMSLFEEI